jgi:hypothetical protein
MPISMSAAQARPRCARWAAALAAAGGVAAMAATTAAAHAPAHTTAATAGCATSALKVSLGRGDGTAGSTFFPLKFKNIGSRACTLRGYPGVSALNRAGHQIGAPATRSGSAVHTVTLNPGTTRRATLRVVDTGVFSRASCRPVTAHALRVFPPNQTRAARIRVGFTVCSKASQPSMSIGTVG